MINDPNNTDLLERVARIIQSGECVLFLGAGVSIDSGVPSAKELADDLAASFFHFPPNSYPLAEVCQLVDANEGRAELNRRIGEMFENNITPKGALLSIPLFRWRSIYTTNFDTLLERAYAESESVQKVRPFYSDRDSLSRLQTNEVPLYKLHGCLTRANSDEGRLVLTAEDYARVRESRQRLFNRLVEDLSDFTILYVGFRREDTDFTEILLSVEKAFGILMGLRRSYALQPGYTEFDANRWAQKRVTLINMKAAEFFTGLEQALPVQDRLAEKSNLADEDLPPILMRKSKITSDILRNVERNFEVIDERLLAQAANSYDFFRGGPPNWGAIAEGADAKRDIQDEILGAVLEDAVFDSRPAQFILLHSEAGTGKTTLLRRIGVELARTWDRLVVVRKPYGDLDFLDLERLASVADERLFVLIDAASTVAREIAEILRKAHNAKTKITIIAGTRTNEWREVQDDLTLPGVEEFELDRLSRDEIERVIDRLTSYQALGLLAGVSREEQIRAFELRADKQLLVALREATEGKAFDDIVVDEYDGIPTVDGQRAYLLIAALHRLGIFMRAGVLHRALQIPLDQLGDRVFTPTTKVIVSQEIGKETEPYYSARHQLIAEIVFDRRVQSERRRVEYYLDLISQLDLGYSSDADAFRRLTRGQNHQLLKDFKEPSNRRDIMAALTSADPQDAFVHQHAAMMELEQGDLEAAASHLHKAIEIRPGDPAIRDTEGRLTLMAAKQEFDNYKADVNYARAEDLFRRNIQRRKDEPYGYKHLAETYVSWSERQATEDRRLYYISLAYETLLNGLKMCTSSSMLFQYLGELEQKVGTADQARVFFAKALEQKPGAIVTRLMAARLEEREGNLANALVLLKSGLGPSPYDYELHYRIADLMAKIEPESDAEIRQHFQAAILGPQRNYHPRLAYAAYLFSRSDFKLAKLQFEALEAIVVSSGERFEVRMFRYGNLCSNHIGRLVRLSYDYGFVEYLQGATEIFVPLRSMPLVLRHRLYQGQMLHYKVKFNLKGPVAVDIEQQG